MARTTSRTQRQYAAYSTTGTPWHATRSILGGALLSMTGYLLIAAIGAVLAITSGLAYQLAQSGYAIIIPFLILALLITFAMNRSIGHLGQEFFWGALLMLLLSPFLALAVLYAESVNPGALTSAGFSVAGSLIITTIIAYVSPWDLSKLSGLAFVGLAGLIITEIIAMFSGAALGLVTSPLWSFLGIAVFELYLVVDFSRIRRTLPYGPRKGLAAYLGMNLALDVINLFIFFLQLFTGQSRIRH